MAAEPRFRNWLLCLWPGLPGTWHQGRLVSLGLALTFALSAQLVAVVCFVWPELVQPALRPVVCFCVAFFWFLFAVRNLAQEARRPGDEAADKADDLFYLAQGEYLKGSWTCAESRLKRLLDMHPQDAEAQLLLATVYRRTQRWDAAEDQLDRLVELPRGEFWNDEIRRERSFVAAGQSSDSDHQIALVDLDAA